MRTGNELWWAQVQDFRQEHVLKTYREAEVALFEILVRRMQEDGMKQVEILNHFKGTFEMGYTAFYNRLRRSSL